ncbi:ferredoxin--NADP reductase [Williamsia sp.]|uniref:ferredoxin--NADP reductase n=1 Tax=Williamsia sp. TaxID=1872085 RepID=UPI001A2A0273|nr:ferredoxin--NADP reductase [Williamsia sp.]MBJ7287537.1 ferredoxin--NADP reductase [Williamsia sp.]
MTVEQDAPPVARSRSRALTVTDVVQETIDSVTIAFDIPDEIVEDFKYAPGQFVTVKIPSEQTGHVARCYSLSSSPYVDDFRLEIGVKRTRDGYASNWLCDNVTVGMEMTVLAPSGQFTAKNLDVDMAFFAGGSGITPVLSLVKSALIAGGGEVVLFYANRDIESVMYGGQLEQIAAEFPERFSMVNWLESERGIPTAQAVTEILSDHKGTEVFMCGPAPFMDLVERAAVECGVNHANVHREVFQSLSGDPFDTATLRRLSDDEGIATATVYLNGDCITVEWPRNTPLLDVLLSQGHNAPYSCREGACSACVCRLVDGDVDMVQNNILVEEDVQDGERLACQALPLTDAVTVSFDAL